MDLIQSYKEELQLIRKPWTRVWAGAFVLFLILLPWWAPQHIIYIATIIFIYSVGVQGQNLLIGYTGQISFGQAGFLAIGAFAFGHLSIHGVPWPFGLFFAGLAAGLFGLVVGFPSLRLKGPYLAIATMGFGIAVYQIFVNSEVLSGGRMGMAVQKLSPLFGLSPITYRYYFNFLMALLFTLASYNIVSSYMGRAFIAIRDNDIAAEVIGVNLTRYKLLSFAVSSFYTGVQGALLGLFLGYLEPNMFTFMESITLFVAVIIGGLASVEGSILGAAFVILVPQVFSAYRDLVPVVYGVTIVFVLIFEPFGLYGRWFKMRLYLRNWPFR
ncbi:MAG: branched-chain amino acid ABC transporter permease [Deltaproteobacteria bacterium]|jgi:branched-chain amino acid transport system permease protein|nr:branched-chain amino acid ABC transporter permease [Deltaproteobacteria bacterium]NTV55741.1 branched-chain amino acid ABC transporter permease [Deltaproteobacteria bacterium]